MSASYRPAPATPSSPPPFVSDPPGALDYQPENDTAWVVEESSVFALPKDAMSTAAMDPALGADDVGELFSAYRSYVAKIGRRILGTSGEVDDLIQDVFVATLRDVHKIKDPARLRAWLATVTTRMAKRRRFRTSMRPTLSPEDPEEVFEHVSEEAPSPESTADLAGNIERVLSLPDELRTPWMLKHVEGRTLEDVAARCECSLSTAARRIQTATGRIQRR